MAEKFGIEGRGKFYDDTGAIRDVVENHASGRSFLAMEAPLGHCDAIRDEQVIFRTISLDRSIWSEVRRTCRKRVAPDSKVETFAAVR